MKIKLFNWLGSGFVGIVGEGKAGVTPEKAVNELFKRFEAELQLHGLSLDNTARVHVWGKRQRRAYNGDCGAAKSS